MSRKLFIATTYYQLLITIAKLMSAGEKADLLLYRFAGDYVFTDMDDKFMSKLRDMGVFDKIFLQESRGFETWPSIKKIFSLRFRRRYLEDLFRPQIDDLSAYSDIYIFGDVSSRSHYFLLTKTPYHLIEGQTNALKRERMVLSDYSVENRLGIKNRIGYFAKKYIFDDFLSSGQAQCCKSIEVNDKSDLGIPTDKVIEVPRDDLLSSLSIAQKRCISDLFIGDDLIRRFEQNVRRSIVLLDSPLAADTLDWDKCLAEKVYGRIIASQQEAGYEVMVKPHPGDHTDYSAIFSGISLINANIPAEVLNLDERIHFDRAIAVYSSAVFGSDFADEKILLGREYVDEVRRRQ
jgi:hypothetical protein